MSTLSTEYTLIDDKAGLQEFYDINQSVEWMGFDTEFIGEKRYTTLLCLVQIATEHGYFLIDTLRIDDLKPLLDLLQDPNILKLTHAGENDYRLFHNLFGITPRNLFDVQIAAGFVGYKYPISFQKLIEREIGVRLSKKYTVSNWETRPMNNKQLQYALDDVIYLQDLYHSISDKLEKMGRSEWAEEEMAQLEEADYYYIDPDREALTSSIMRGLRFREKVFLLRLYEWRRQRAEQKNHSKEMVLQNKYIAPIVRQIGAGKQALKNHRRIPDHIIDKNWNAFNKLLERPVTDEEKAKIDNIPQGSTTQPEDDTTIQLLQLLIKYKCNQHQLSPDLLLNRTDFKKMKTDPEFFDEQLAQGWRKDFLGPRMIDWLRKRENLDIDFRDDDIVIHMA